jgi:ABC-type branched-subunit amino acid transport system substrate-binding protein
VQVFDYTKWRLPLPAIVLAAMAASSFAACGGGDEGSSKASAENLDCTLKIGAALPLTGDAAAFGPPLTKGVQLAGQVAQAAADKTRLGMTVKVVSEDTQTDPKAAVEAATKLVQADDVSAIVGSATSSETLPMAESVAVPNQVVLITPAATGFDQHDLQDDDYVFRTVTPDTVQAKVAARVIGKVLGEDATINSGARNDAGNTIVQKTFEAEWKANGGKIGKSVQWNPESPNFDSDAQALASGNPDGWFIVDFPDTYAKVGAALVRTGKWDAAKTFTLDGLRTDSLPKDAGTEATEGLRGTAPTGKGSSAEPAFAALWKQKAGMPRQVFDSHAFDAAVLSFLAAVKAGGCDGTEIRDALTDVSGPPGKRVTFEDLGVAIKTLRSGGDIDYDGVAGPEDLDEVGDPKAGSYETWQFKGGKIVTTGLEKP